MGGAFSSREVARRELVVAASFLGGQCALDVAHQAFLAVGQKMARAGGGRPELFAATQCRHSRTVSTYGFGSVFGAHSLNTISVLFVLVMIEIHPSPARTSRTLLAHSAQGVLARRRQEEPPIMLCIGVSASEFAAPDLSGKLVNQKTPCVYKRPPTLRASTSTVTTCWSSRKTC